jgi:hypothetical protein
VFGDVVCDTLGKGVVAPDDLCATCQQCSCSCAISEPKTPTNVSVLSQRHQAREQGQRAEAARVFNVEEQWAGDVVVDEALRLAGAHSR